MMKTVVSYLQVLLVFLLCFVSAGCSKDGNKQVFHRQAAVKGRNPAPSVNDMGFHRNATVKGRNLAPSVNDMGFRLYAKLNGSGSRKNIFISPISIEFALAMTYNGARGTTKDAMAKVLGYSGMSADIVNASNENLMKSLMKPAEGLELDIANSIWSRKAVDSVPISSLPIKIIIKLK